MTQAIIRHCPDSPAVLALTEDAVLALLGQDVLVEVMDGESGEFTIVVDGEDVVASREGALPSVEDVVAAVNAAGALFLAV